MFRLSMTSLKAKKKIMMIAANIEGPEGIGSVIERQDMKIDGSPRKRAG